MMEIKEYGWNDYFDNAYMQWKDSGLKPGRVVSSSGQFYGVVCGEGRKDVSVSGHFKYTASGPDDYPAAGDWVLLRHEGDSSIIERVLPRRTAFTRRASGGSSQEQVIAANIDYMFIAASIEGGRQFTERGLERYIVMVRDSGAEPVIILNKCDLASVSEREDFTARAVSVSGDIPVLMVSALTGEGMESLRKLLVPGITAAFTGPSGVGKSALINALSGSGLQATGETRQDDLKGRHTTTRRELFLLESGAMLIDTPGLRELSPSGDMESLDLAFEDIAAAALQCRFSDCSHMDEPGCAVLQQVADGYIDQARYENYIRLRSEMESLERLRSERGRSEKRSRDKEISKLIKRYNREHRD